MIQLANILKEVTSPYKLYCDLDGVLVNFEKGYVNLTGQKPPPYGIKYDAKAFWDPIAKAGAPFWVNLEWMPDGKALWNYIKPYSPSILSAPSRDKSSGEGKTLWMNQNLPGVHLILKPASKKQELASPNSILIDDREDNIQRWKDAGGIGIRHTSTADTIKQLKKLGL